MRTSLSTIAADSLSRPWIYPRCKRVVFIQVCNSQHDTVQIQLTLKMMRNNQIRAFRTLNTSARITDPFLVSSCLVLTIRACEPSNVSQIYKLMMGRKPLTAHQSESEPAPPLVLRAKPWLAYTPFLALQLQTMQHVLCEISQTKAAGQQQDV
jgi:hypothetical protein